MYLRELLKEKGMTQKELAAKIDMTPANVSLIILNDSTNVVTLEKIAAALDVPMWRLFATPQDIFGDTKQYPVYCPHCGKPIRVSLRLESALG